MLEAVSAESDGGGQLIVGIEIDPLAQKAAEDRFAPWTSPRPHVLLGSAFDPEILRKLPALSFDLVITNPPYVRYQSLSKTHDGEITLPGAVEVRSGLLQSVELFPSLDPVDRLLFRSLISGYSGLSDLALPSWILCAMLTRVGGKLAMVVPEAWLTRDYAQVIQYMLLRWFKISYVVEDAHAAWFSDAQIKTTLLVAERIQRRRSAFAQGNEEYLHLRIPRVAANDASIVGNLFPQATHPEASFVDLLEHLSQSESRTNTSLPIPASWVPLRQSQDNLWRSALKQKWLNDVENTLLTEASSVNLTSETQAAVPAALARWLAGSSQARLTTLLDLHIGVSQGLRTGANQFFYVDTVEEDGDEVVVATNPVFGLFVIRIPRDCTVPVLRRQSELGNVFSLDSSTLRGRALMLDQYMLPEDFQPHQANGSYLSRSVHNLYKLMPDDLACYVRVAGRTNVGSIERPQFIPAMSAVRTNASTAGPNSTRLAPRFWYMLPPFAPRHRPDLFVPRVNNLHPRAYLNAPDHVLIDANFATLWIEDHAQISRTALLAVLNSSWCVTAMELMASVMGGGALKLEATHLRRLPIPNLNSIEWSRLAGLGDRLATGNEAASIIREIDLVVVTALTGAQTVEERLAELESIKATQLSLRSRRGRG